MRRPETLIARGLPYGVDRCELTRLFPTCRNIKLHYDRDSGNSTGTAFIEFNTVDEMRSAIEDHRRGRMRFKGRAFHLEHCHPKRVDIAGLREQIEHDFSDKNLNRDPLFQKLVAQDPEGWVHFDDLYRSHKIKRLGAYDEDISLALQSSKCVELFGSCLRRVVPFVLDPTKDRRHRCTLNNGECPAPSKLCDVQPRMSSRALEYPTGTRRSICSLETARETFSRNASVAASTEKKRASDRGDARYSPASHQSRSNRDAVKACSDENINEKGSSAACEDCETEAKQRNDCQKASDWQWWESDKWQWDSWKKPEEKDTVQTCNASHESRTYAENSTDDSAVSLKVGQRYACREEFTEEYGNNVLRLAKGECVTLIAPGENGWARCLTLDGRDGFFPPDYLGHCK